MLAGRELNDALDELGLRRIERQEAEDGSPRRTELKTGDGGYAGAIYWQCGPVSEFGHNGTTISAVLDLISERLDGLCKVEDDQRTYEAYEDASYFIECAITALSDIQGHRK